MTCANDKDKQPEGINKRRLVVILLALPIFSVLVLFLPAETWAWTKGWLFILILLGLMAGVHEFVERLVRGELPVW